MLKHADSTLAAEFRNVYLLIERLDKSRPVVVVSDVQPVSPADNTIWVNGTAHEVKLWDGAQWVTLS